MEKTYWGIRSVKVNMEHFPEETIAEAKRIADLYRKRWPSRARQVSALFERSFLEAKYGFEAALRSGKCGHFLHELENDAECFSWAGMIYVVANELGFEPKIYDARDMRDVKYGQNPLDCSTGDHCFPTVKYGGKEWAVDSLMGILGEVKHHDDHLEIIEHSEGGLVKRIPTERWFSSLAEISEDDYIKEMRKHQSSEGGKITLGCGQRVPNKGEFVMVQYLPDTESLISSIHFGKMSHIQEELLGKDTAFELEAPVEKDGSWAVDMGKIRVYWAESLGWTREQDSLVHRVIEYDYDTVKRFRNHLDTAARHFGRKGKLDDLNPRDVNQYFYARGFSPTGDLTCENGVEPKEHQRLLDEIILGFPKEEPSEAIDSINQEVAYFSAHIKAIDINNPQGLVYSQTERDGFVKEYLEKCREDMEMQTYTIYQKFEFDCGMGKNSKALERRLLSNRNRIDKVSHFMRWVNTRKDSKSDFNHEIDMALFQRAHPCGSVKPSKEELRNWYRHQAFRDMIEMCYLLPALELKKYRCGFKKILSS